MQECDDLIYAVVINAEEQYSVWPEYRLPPPAGWTLTGQRGSRSDCLQHIALMWTDMRPASLRRAMDSHGD